MLKRLALIAIISAAAAVLVSKDAFAAEGAGGSRLFVLNAPSTGSAGFDSILTFDPSGDGGILFGAHNRILGARTVVCGPVEPRHILLPVTNFSLGIDSVLEIDSTGQVINVTPGLGGPAGGGSRFAFDAAGNTYVAALSTIFKNGTPFAAIPVPGGVGDLAIDSRGNIYVSYPFSEKIFRVDPSGLVTVFAESGVNGLKTPFGLAVDSADNLLVASNPPSAPGVILKFTPAGTSTVFASNITFQPGIRSLAFHDGVLYVPLSTDNQILAFDSTGHSTVFADDTDGVNAPVAISVGACPVAEPLVTMLNDTVSFTPLPSTFQTSSDNSGCPPVGSGGVTGTFRFSGTLTNTSGITPLRGLYAQVKTLTNGNVLRNADGGPFGATAVLTVPRTGGFADGLLNSGESVDVPFDVCFRASVIRPGFPPDSRFTFLVDVLGIKGGDTAGSAER